MKQPQNDSKYEWTQHAWSKMQQYRISEGRIKRIIRFPSRTEEGVAPDTVAVMQPSGTTRYSEIWVMYRLSSKKPSTKIQNFSIPEHRIKVITAWRYPGKSPARDPVPTEILEEIQNFL